jgi:hypothetical protein
MVRGFEKSPGDRFRERVCDSGQVGGLPQNASGKVMLRERFLAETD